MRALFGVVSLLVVVVIVGLLASRQLKTVTAVPSSDSGGSAAAPATVREQSQQLQEKVRSDVTKALEQGARKDESDK